MLNILKQQVYNAKMNPNIVPLDQHLQDKHFYRKHGLNAAYRQR